MDPGDFIQESDGVYIHKDGHVRVRLEEVAKETQEEEKLDALCSTSLKSSFMFILAEATRPYKIIDVSEAMCAFSGYHAVRREFRKLVEELADNQSELTGPQLRTSWSVFASTFSVEARELAVECRHFSLPSFLSYLHPDDARSSESSFLNHE